MQNHNVTVTFSQNSERQTTCTTGDNDMHPITMLGKI